jgi:hypothetical protein
MLASNPARILEQISRRARIPLTQESTSGDHALVFAVGTVITDRPPHRSERAEFPHSAPTLGV